MRKTLSIAAVALVSAVGANSAYAADATVPFAGLVTSTCALTVGTPGVMSASTDFKSLSSTNAAGVAGTVTALSTGTNYKVSAIAPTTFKTAPAGGGDDVTFAATYSGAGSTSIGSTPGATTTTLNAGTTVVSVNLAATKGSGTFNGGAYTAEVIVRCE